ncbi:MAG TPA: flagellar biosynthesis protein FlhB [Tepidisphaeraceae bacterium]|jgi:flagellar biosynthetic protein FlhB
MADDTGDKTEAPTPRRRAEAREQGNIARSQDLTVALMLLGVMITLNSTGPRLVNVLKILLHSMLSAESLSDFSGRGATNGALHAVYAAGAALAPLLIAVMVIACVSNIVQVGINFNPQKLMPNLAALNPTRGFGKLFSSRSPIQLGMSVIKMAILSMVAYSALRNRMGQVASVQKLDFLQIFGLSASLVYSIAMRVGIAMLIIAIIDYAIQRWRHERDLRMSKQDVKEEMRRMDGDPKIKLRRRQIAMTNLRRKLKKDVPTADVVVTNPTEFAIALKYDSKAMHAPRVIAKGQGLIAQRIREIAIEAGVPILERKPLARALYKLVEVGQEIPEQFYAAVAEILAYVYELSGKGRQRQPA